MDKNILLEYYIDVVIENKQENKYLLGLSRINNNSNLNHVKLSWIGDSLLIYNIDNTLISDIKNELPFKNRWQEFNVVIKNGLDGANRIFLMKYISPNIDIFIYIMLLIIIIASLIKKSRY